ncbi:MAG: transcription elongation factor Spt5 [Conexivisphaera sp.]|jgi:transcriptional antiterminator NusG|nr:transcription elongation factor Spt5 [Conexivisphaerales archaeon]PMP94057.1 MAG: transcription elongation factor Spt5 [Nitrososphaera sp.]
MSDSGSAGARGTQLFAVKVVSGQENNVAKLIATRVQLRGLNVYSVLVLPRARGYVVLEADGIESVNDAISGIKNVKSVVPGMLRMDDVKSMLTMRKEEVKLDAGDLVEVISGPFKGMKARVVRFEEGKKEATVNLVDVPYQLQVTVDANYLRKVQQ